MNLANKLTILRVILIPVFIFVLMFDKLPAYSNWIALGIFVIASLTDLFDGMIARKKNMVTNFGKFMDPLADKLLVCSALVCLMELGRTPWYLVLIVIARDFVISGFRLLASDRGIVLAANKLGKAKTMIQMIYIGILIGNITALGFVEFILSWIVIILTIISLVVYICRNYKVLLEEK